MPDTKLAVLVDRNVSFIWRRRNLLKIPKFCGEVLPRRCYRIDCFEKVDNSETAYWLGMYFSDGCVCQSGRRKLITLCSQDLEILQKLHKFFGLGDNIYSRIQNEKHVYSLQLCNSRLFDSLVALGCVPRKSNVIEAPKIASEFFDAFLMGVFDGDGCISRNSSINSWKASIGTGSEVFCDWLASILEKKDLSFSIEHKTIRDKSFYVISLCGVYAKVFLAKLYDSVNADLPLGRKKDRYDLLCQQKLKAPNYLGWEIEIIKKYRDDLEKCVLLLNNDIRNYGWIRSKDSLRHKVKYLH